MTSGRKKTKRKRTDYSKAKTWLSEKQWRRLSRQHMHLQNALILYLLYGCALRVSELLGIRLRDVDFAKNMVTVRWLKHKGPERTRKVPVPKAAMELLVKLARDVYPKPKPDHFVLTNTPRPMYRSVVNNRILSLARKAKLPMRVTPHTLRRSRATHLYDRGLELAKVSQLLGHAKLETTRVYLNLAPDKLAADLKKVDPLEA